MCLSDSPHTDADLSRITLTPNWRLHTTAWDLLSLEASCTQTLISAENATKVIFTICPALLGAIMGTCWKKSLCFPHVGLCYFFHPPSQEAAEISGKRPLSVFSEAKRVVPLYFRKGKCCLVQPNHYLENNCKESNPLLFMPKEAAWAAFWMLPLLFARGQKSHIDNGLCSRGATHLLKLWV